MRTSTLRALLVLALLAAAHPASADFGWGGNLGLSFQRDDAWGGAYSQTSATQAWFAGSLHLDASFFTPGTLSLMGSASYFGYRAVGGAGSDALNYQLSVTALARTPLTLSAGASRTTTDFTSNTSSGVVGTIRSDSFRGGAIFSLIGYPVAAASIVNSATTNHTIGGPAISTNSTNVNGEVSQSVDSLNYDITYDTAWSSGDYAETNYKSHATTFRALASLTPEVTASLNASYVLRDPTLNSPLNPRIDNQGLSSWVQWTSGSDFWGGAGYTYADSLFEAPGSPLRQIVSHALSGSGSKRLSDSFALDLSASGATTEETLGTFTQRATGEQVGTGLRWNQRVQEVDAQASFNANVGLFQPSVGSDTAAWSVSTGGSASRAFPSFSGSAGLNASYDTNTGASAGHRTHLLANLAASGMPFGWSASSTLTGGYSRAESPTFGATRAMNLRLDAQAFHSGFALTFNAGITDDLAEVLVPGAPPASLLAPVDFNTRSEYVVASAVIPTVTNLSLGLLGRYATTSSPGRVSQWESGLSITAAYYLGAFQFSLYDQITTGGYSGVSSGTQNLVFFSVTRSFGR